MTVNVGCNFSSKSITYSIINNFLSLNKIVEKESIRVGNLSLDTTWQALWCQTITPLSGKPRNTKQLPHSWCQLSHSASLVMPNSYPIWQASWCQTATHMVPRDAKQLPLSASLNSFPTRKASWCQTVTPLSGKRLIPNSYPTWQASWCQTVTPFGKLRDAKQLPIWCHKSSFMMLNSYPTRQALWCQTATPLGGKPRDTKQLPHSASLMMANSYPIRQASWCQTVTSLCKPRDAKQLPTWCHTSSLVMPNSYPTLQAPWCQTFTPPGKPHNAEQLPH